MNLKRISPFLTLLLCIATQYAHARPEISITFSKLYATYDFVQKLSDNYPDNKYKQLFKASAFNTPRYNNYLKQLDTTSIYEAYLFEGYPTGQKIPGTTTALIDKGLVACKSIPEFKQRLFGVIPNTELFMLASVIEAFEPIYDSIIYIPNKVHFDNKFNHLKQSMQQADMGGFFATGLKFYNTTWDDDVPFDIAIVPSVNGDGFSAKAFLNNAASEVPVKFDNYNILISVLMHEIFHILYDGQSLQYKLEIERWFKENPSPNTQYAYLLLNEVLATAAGNGFVYEQLAGKLDKTGWYNNKYINKMAKKMYPAVKEYLARKNPIDQPFINAYIRAYDENFADWVNELDNLFTNRYVITDNGEDLDYFRTNYPYASNYQSGYPITQSALETMREVPITKVIIISKDHKQRMEMIRQTFPELKDQPFDSGKDFIYTTATNDKTKLILINSLNGDWKGLFEKTFKKGRLN
jgi:hypothetical protein